jgi:hypothetical protein
VIGTPRGTVAAMLGAEAVVVIVAVSTHRTGVLHLVAALVIAPCACAGTGAAGRRLGGRRFGLATSIVYVLLPLFGIAYSLSAYRHTFVHGALPQLVGLEAPAQLALGAALAVAVATLPRSILGAAGAIAAAVALATWGIHPLTDVRNGLHETGWSIALLEWAFVAGTIGAATRSVGRAIALAGWLLFVVLHAAHGGYGAHAEFWRSLAPATPAIAVLLSSLALLVPRLRPAPIRARPLDAP